MSLTTQQIMTLHHELSQKLHKARQTITALTTGEPTYPFGIVGKGGDFYKRMEDRAFALFEIRKVSDELREAELVVAALHEKRKGIDTLRTIPEEEVYAEMQQIAAEHGIEVK